MKQQNRINALIAVILAAAISVSGIGCMVTAFRLAPADNLHIASMCVFFALLCALFCSFRWGPTILTLLSVLLGAAMLFWGDLSLSLEKLVYDISRFYDSAYGWGLFRWSEASLSDITPDSALTVIGCLIALVCCWTVCRRKWFGCAAIAGLFPLSICCVVTDTIPESIYLWILLTALVLLILTQRIRRINIIDSNRLTALLLVPVILCNSFLFRYEPEEGFQAQAQSLQDTLLGWFQDVVDILQGEWDPFWGLWGPPVVLSDKVDLSNAGPIDLGKDRVMTVQTQKTSGVLYLRGKSYNYYTGTSWGASVDTKGENGWLTGLPAVADSVTVKSSIPLALRYFSYYPEGNDWPTQLKDGAIPNSGDLLKYAFRIMRALQPWDIDYTDLTQEEKDIYLQLPEQTQTQAEALLAQLEIHDATATEDIVAIIDNYVSSSARYDTNTPAMPSGEADFAIWFLEESSTGYCVHFATAATVLLRAAGIPARYVTGYVTSVAAGSECAVTADQSHAWVEYLHPDTGWTSLDPTPSMVAPPVIIPPPTEPTKPTTEPSTEPTTRPTTEPTLPTESQPSSSNTPSGSTQNSTAPSDATQPGQTLPGDQTGSQHKPIRLNLKWMRYLLVIAVIWLALAGQYRLRIRLRKKRLTTGGHNQQACARWRWACRLSRITGHSAQALLPLAEKAAFSQHTLTEAELAEFDRWFEAAEQALMGKPWLRQFFLRLIFAIE